MSAYIASNFLAVMRSVGDLSGQVYTKLRALSSFPGVPPRRRSHVERCGNNKKSKKNILGGTKFETNKS